MKKIAAVAAAVLASVALAAPAQASAPDHNRHDLALYTSFLHAKMPGAATMPDKLMHVRGDVFCRGLANGVSVESAMALGAAAGMSDKATITMLVAAVKWLCPAEQHVLDSFMNS